jgi:hypothetical protein
LFNSDSQIFTSYAFFILGVGLTLFLVLLWAIADKLHKKYLMIEKKEEELD